MEKHLYLGNQFFNVKMSITIIWSKYGNYFKYICLMIESVKTPNHCQLLFKHNYCFPYMKYT